MTVSLDIASSTNRVSHVQKVRAPLCRLCKAPLTTTFVDLGMSPSMQSFVAEEQIDQMEAKHYPLHVLSATTAF